VYHLLMNEDQLHITESVRGFLGGRLPIERWRSNGQINEHAEVSDELQCWNDMVELGWFGLGVSEDDGGAGFGLPEEILLLRECGRSLVSPTIMSTMLAVHVAIAANDHTLAQDIIYGKHRVAMTTQASELADTDSNRQIYLFDHNDQDLLLLMTRFEDNDASVFTLFDASQLHNIQDKLCLDESISMKAAELHSDTPHCQFADKNGQLSARLRVMSAAMLCGIANAALDLSVEYAKIREQFGQPIGRFQAIKHKCTDMAVRVELAWAQTMEACLDVQYNRPDAVLKAASAKWLSSDAVYRNGDSAIQIHGGIGFQAECNAHLFVKRGHVYDHFGGTMQQQEKSILAQSSPL
jgi:alkylation response protein AidB-like acyl-CoA dehydrogenase